MPSIANIDQRRFGHDGYDGCGVELALDGAALIQATLLRHNRRFPIGHDHRNHRSQSPESAVTISRNIHSRKIQPSKNRKSVLFAILQRHLTGCAMPKNTAPQPDWEPVLR